jgi:hypothetical protein
MNKKGKFSKVSQQKIEVLSFNRKSICKKDMDKNNFFLDRGQI